MHRYASELARHLKEFSALSIEEISIKGTRLPFLRDTIAKDFFYPLYARSKQGDINQIIDHSYGALAYCLDPRRTVVTCHDLTPLELKSQSSWLGRQRFLYNVRGMLRAKNIVADSESTKKSILKHFHYPGKIWVIPPGIGEKFKKSSDPKQIMNVKERLGLDKSSKYLLHVGLSTPTKNVELILRTLSELPECRLIKVGAFTQAQKGLIDRLNLKDRILSFEGISEEALVEIYNVADLLVFPSFFEGFGWPVLEAMACGCPVICSKTSALPEVAGEAAIYIDPYSETDLKGAIEEVLGNEDLRNELIQKGFKQAQKFSWKKTAQEVLQVYQQMVSL
jgi:glycosyltransferase involved in cell wall biosynthesis